MDSTRLLTPTPLVPPPSQGKGLLYRDDKPGSACGFLSDYPAFDVIPVSDWAQYIDQGITMRDDVQFIYSQGQVGSCAAESACGGLDLARSICGYDAVKFNPYATYHYSSGGSDRGSTLTENLRLLREMGAFPESIWPRSRGWRTKPSAAAHEQAKKYRILEFFEIKSWEEFGSALLHRFPVYWGYSGHAILAVGLPNTSQIIYRNSWSDNWGDSGFGVANASQIIWGYGVFAICNAIFPDDEQDAL